MASVLGIPHRLPNGKGILVKVKQGGIIHWFTQKRMVATTIGRNIYVKKGMALSDIGLKHELAHVDQWYMEGFVKFFFKYFYYQIKYGYDKNPYEQQARVAAGQPTR